MRITEEMRTWAEVYPWKSDHDAAEVRALADRIDVAHGREVDEAREMVFSMPNHRVALPVDADGVPIHLGDEVHHTYDLPKFHYPVETLALTEEGWEVDGCNPCTLQHWKAPTVEDVLQEFRDVVQECQDTEDTVAEYARRIKEAMGDER